MKIGDYNAFPEDWVQINEKLKVMRLCKGWTQEALAEKLGWAVNTYAKIERGEANVKLDKLHQLAEAIGIDPTDLLNGGERTVFNFAENCTNTQSNLGHTILLSEAQCAHELEKAGMIVAQKDREIGYLKEENQNLREIIALLKGKQQ
ncbi:MAG: helix-turn-helix transcriptional regulator [Chromatiaceae bacterium]|nr:helix-turn-helix transcriptional regulator [Chromatiaceae bacterium]